jgi:glycosyltransferase involved in cell wall biosynthesis
MSRAWIAAGHEVTVLAGTPNWPTGVVHPGYGKVMLRERYEGVPVIRSWVYATPNEGVVKRIANHMSFAISAPTTAFVTGQRPDVVVATSPPIFAAAAGAGFASLRRAPFVLDVRDLWPDAIFALGQMQQRPLKRTLMGLERWLYRHSASVVAVTDPFAEHIRRRGGKDVHVIPNGADTDFFTPGPPDEGLRRRLGWEGKFVVLYAGTIGMAHGLSDVLDSAEILAGRRDDVFIALVGEGADKEALERSARHRGLKNVGFEPLQPRTDMPALYRSADACLVSLRPISLFDSFIPSKVFEIMACGRPILASVSGVALDIVLRAGAGIGVQQGSPDSLAASIENLLARSKAEREEMGEAGRSFVCRDFDRRTLAERYLQILDAVAAPRQP